MILEFINTILPFIEKYKKCIAYNEHIKNSTQFLINELDNLEWASSVCSYPCMPGYIRIILFSLLDVFDSKHWEKHTLLKRKAKIKFNEISTAIQELEKRSKELKAYYHVNTKHHLILEEKSLQHLRKLFQEFLTALEHKNFLDNIYTKIFKF